VAWKFHRGHVKGRIVLRVASVVDDGFSVSLFYFFFAISDDALWHADRAIDRRVLDCGGKWIDLLRLWLSDDFSGYVRSTGPKVVGPIVDHWSGCDRTDRTAYGVIDHLGDLKCQYEKSWEYVRCETSSRFSRLSEQRIGAFLSVCQMTSSPRRANSYRMS